MIDTLTLHIKGKNNQDFELNENRFKKVTSENNELDVLHNTFYSDRENRKQPIYVMNNLKNNYALVQCSASKLLYGNSLQNVKIEDTRKLEGILQNRLNGIFDADFMNSNISRLDVSQNIETNEDIPFYIYGLREAYEQNGKFRLDLFSNETLMIKNNSRRFIFYDKVKEALANKDITRNEAKAYGNILRFEVQHSKAKHVKTSLGKVFTLSEILTEDFFKKAKQFHLNSFEKFFSNAGNYELFMNDISILDAVMKYNKRNVLKNFLLKSVTDKSEFKADWKYYETLLSAKGMTRQGIAKSIKEVKKILALGKVKRSDILNELITKLAG